MCKGEGKGADLLFYYVISAFSPSIFSVRRAPFVLVLSRELRVEKGRISN